MYFGSFGMSPAYEYMQQVAPNIVWGTLVAMFGIVQLSCFMFGTQGARCLAALFSCWVFAVLSGFTVDSAWDIPTPYIYGVLALANAWATAQLTT